jgi:hypothetical protein
MHHEDEDLADVGEIQQDSIKEPETMRAKCTLMAKYKNRTWMQCANISFFYQFVGRYCGRYDCRSGTQSSTNLRTRPLC